jgi:hypothetical protein
MAGSNPIARPGRWLIREISGDLPGLASAVDSEGGRQGAEQKGGESKCDEFHAVIVGTGLD